MKTTVFVGLGLVAIILVTLFVLIVWACFEGNPFSKQVAHEIRSVVTADGASLTDDDKKLLNHSGNLQKNVGLLKFGDSPWKIPKYLFYFHREDDQTTVSRRKVGGTKWTIWHIGQLIRSRIQSFRDLTKSRERSWLEFGAKLLKDDLTYSNSSSNLNDIYYCYPTCLLFTDNTARGFGGPKFDFGYLVDIPESN